MAPPSGGVIACGKRQAGDGRDAMVMTRPRVREDEAVYGAGVRPPLKWAGGKRWLVPHLRPLWERHRGRRLVEPLCGGLAVTLGLLPERALLNDINPHAINFYRRLKQGLVVDLPMANA